MPIYGGTKRADVGAPTDMSQVESYLASIETSNASISQVEQVQLPWQSSYLASIEVAGGSISYYTNEVDGALRASSAQKVTGAGVEIGPVRLQRFISGQIQTGIVSILNTGQDYLAYFNLLDGPFDVEFYNMPFAALRIAAVATNIGSAVTVLYSP